MKNGIFWALEFYAKSADNEKAPSWGRIIAHSIVEKIKEEELTIRTKNN